MITSRFISRNLFHSKNIFTPNTIKYNNVFNFSNFKPPAPTDIDTGNILGLLDAKQTPFLSIWEKLSEFRFGTMYQGLDQFSRQLLFTFANDLGWGLPLGIIGVSIMIRAIFFYPGLIAQVNGMKMKQIQPHMKRYQQKMQAAQMSRNKSLMTQARKQFNQIRKQKGIDTFIPLINLAQIPFLITWFLSLRYITNLPQVFPQLQTQQFLWIKDLSAYDPYFILPIVSASVMSLSLIYSPNLNKQNVTMSFMIPFIKYIKFMPFLSLPVTAMFPAAINVYWCTISFVQLATTAILHTKYFKEHAGILQKVQKQKIIQAAFVQQKRIDNNNQQGLGKVQKQSKKPILNSQAKVQTIQILSNKPKKAKVIKEK